MMDALGYGQSALSEAGHEGIQTYGADEMHGISLLPVMRGETDTVREVAIAGYYDVLTVKLVAEDWSYPLAQERYRHRRDEPPFL